MNINEEMSRITGKNIACGLPGNYDINKYCYKITHGGECEDCFYVKDIKPFDWYTPEGLGIAVLWAAKADIIVTIEPRTYEEAGLTEPDGYVAILSTADRVDEVGWAHKNNPYRALCTAIIEGVEG